MVVINVLFIAANVYFGVKYGFWYNWLSAGFIGGLTVQGLIFKYVR